MRYSVITPTKNEAKYIESLIQSMVSQAILPTEWFIMDDGSSDQTTSLVQKYTAQYPFIKYVQLQNYRPDLVNTGGRVAAIFNYADSLRTLPVDLIVKQDADTSFDPDFYRLLMHEFENDPALGVASGHLVENGIPEKISDRKAGRGANMVIRYSCFEQIGKLYVSKTRGEDVLCFTAARAKGWKTQSFDIYFNHNKPEGVRASKLRNHYVTGYYKGSIPYYLPFYLANLLRDAFKKPYFIGALVQAAAFIASFAIDR